MVEKEEILHVADLMCIRIDDHKKYVGHIMEILKYFDTLDRADVESEEIDLDGTDIENLRDDEYSKFEKPLIKSLKNHNGTHVRAPKMI